VGLVYLAISLLNGQWMVYRLREVIVQGLRLIGSAFIGLPIALIQSSHHEESESTQEKSKGKGWAILRGVLIAIPLLVILGCSFRPLTQSSRSGFPVPFRGCALR